MAKELEQSGAKLPTTVKSLFQNDSVKAKFNEILGKKSAGFMASVLQIASLNLPANVDPKSVLNAALLAATLDLPVNNNLGFVYIVSYNQKQKDGSYKQVAQAQMGYRAFVQLAQRTGLYKTISAAPIYEGQLVSENPLTGYEFDFTKKTSDTIIGFAGYFSLVNGFEKTIYMTLDEMKAHGLKYSKTFKTGLWQSDFIGMGNKTVLKLLLSKFAPLSIEMQKAISSDQSVINDVETDDYTYVDSSYEEVEVDHEATRLLALIENATTEEELKGYLGDLDMDDADMVAKFEEKMKSLKGKK